MCLISACKVFHIQDKSGALTNTFIITRCVTVQHHIPESPHPFCLFTENTNGNLQLLSNGH